jgi:hypothetical protein
MKETKRDICPDRDTFAFCFLFRGAKVARPGIERGSNHRHIAPRERGSLLVEDNGEKGLVDLNFAVVLDEA